MLIAILLFLLVLCSGSALCCAGAGRRFEELVPLTGIGVVLVLFLFGLAGALAAGVYAVLALALAAWALAAVQIKKRGFRPFARRFFTPGFGLFVFLAAALLFCNGGRAVASWDDFTHWADVVKVMLAQGAFATQPGSHALFPEYPPGVSLMLYFLQRLIALCAPGRGLTEWALFYAQQLFYFSFFLPFARKLDLRRPYAYVLLLLVFLLPLNISMHELVYQRLTVDTFLAVVCACTLAQGITERDRGPLFRGGTALCLAFMAMFKGLGVLCAAGTGLVLLLTEPEAGQSRRDRLRLGLGNLCAALVPWILWSTHVHMQGVKRAFPLALGGLLGENGYRLTCAKSFFKAFLNRNLAANLETNTLWLTPVFLLSLVMALLLFCLRRYGQVFPAEKRRNKKLFWALLAFFLVQTGAVCLAYMFAFSVEEALELACFERYVGTVLLTGGFLFLLLAADLIRLGALDGTRTAALLFCAQALLSPWTPATDFTLRGGVGFSQEYRQAYQGVVDRAEEITGGVPSRFFLISADSVDKITLRYVLRPHTVQIDNVDQTEFLDLVWDGGIPNGYDGQGELSPAQAWMEDLRENYDYVLIFQLNEGLAEKFGAAFSDPSEIRPESIYRVDRSTGQLNLCS